MLKRATKDHKLPKPTRIEPSKTALKKLPQMSIEKLLADTVIADRLCEKMELVDFLAFLKAYKQDMKEVTIKTYISRCLPHVQITLVGGDTFQKANSFIWLNGRSLAISEFKNHFKTLCKGMPKVFLDLQLTRYLDLDM